MEDKQQEEIYQYWRQKLVTDEFGDFLTEVRADDHDGHCWDSINALARILTEPTQELLNKGRITARLKEIEKESPNEPR